MVSGNDDTTPQSMGYGSITCPVKQGKLSGNWYGLVWKVHLGDFGSGHKGVPLDIRLLTAWSPGGESGGPMLFIGMQLPMGLNTEGLDIMGILNLGFNSIELIARDNDNGKRDYICSFTTSRLSFWAFRSRLAQTTYSFSATARALAGTPAI